MGLDITVGLYADLVEHDEEGAEWFREELDGLNDVLRRHGIAPHEEPGTLPGGPVSFEMYGYSGLHYLRRYAAYVWAGDAPEPLDDEADPTEDPLYERYYETLFGGGVLSRFRKREPTPRARFEHLMVHADNEGFYVPQEFARPLVEGDTMIGSSHALLRECEELAESLELPPTLTQESEDLWEAAEDPRGPERWRRFGRESFSCAALRDASRASVDLGALLVFH